MTKIKIESGKFAGTYEITGEKVVWVQFSSRGEIRTTVGCNTSRYNTVMAAR